MEKLAALGTYLAEVGPAKLPGGSGVLRLLEWDQYVNYYPHGYDERCFFYRVDLSLLSAGGTGVRIRQTVQMREVGVHRKHECTYAFDVSNVEGIEQIAFDRKHPGAGPVVVRGVNSDRLLTISTYPGVPRGVLFRFKAPVLVHRWSCGPITHDPVEQETSVLGISIWLPHERAATRVEETFAEAMAEHPRSSEPTWTIAPSPFGGALSVPPGGIDRR